MDPTDLWRSLMARPVVYLDEGALLVSAHADPGLDVAAQLGRLDGLASRVGEATTAGVVDLLFHEMALRGDTDRYDDPRNSYIDQVLDRRRGIPISLSILLIEVGRRCGLALEGVGMPGHFLVRDPEDPDRLVDAFGAGRRLDRVECMRLFQAAVGPRVAFDRSALASTGTTAILARVLTNLDRSFRARGDLCSLGWVTTLRLAIPGQPLSARVELAVTLSELGRHAEAAAVLEEASGEDGVPAGTADELGQRATAARARLN